MGWAERLKEAAYTPPSGSRLTFDFEDVSKETDKKTTVFTFPDRDGAYVQDLGIGGRRYPMLVFFWGDNYDTEARKFYEALEETGGGILEHPAYGRKEVVPTGTIKQRDDLKTAANQAVIEVVFWESIFDLTFPTATTAPTTAALEAINEFTISAPPQFVDTLSIVTSSETAGFTSKFSAGLAATRSALLSVVSTDAALWRQFDAAYDAITTNISDLVAAPAQLAADTIALMRLPAEAAATVEGKLQAYATLIEGLTSVSFVTSFDSQPDNAFIGDQLLVDAAHIALIESTILSEFSARPEAISAAEIISASLTVVTGWADTNRNALGLIDTGETYQTLISATSTATGRLVEISFTLLQERIFTLQSPRTPLDLIAELYGELDGKLDFFINSNNLVGTELLEVPAGREVRFYE
jgi:prophage DNA circulation protein